MIRNLKSLGLVLVAVFAMSAIGASAASAGVEFHSEVENTTWKGAQATKHLLTFKAGNFKCETVTLGATTTNSKTRTTLELGVAFATCTLAGAAVNVTLNGCFYKLNQPTATEGPIHGSMSIVCIPAGGMIEISLGATCTIKIREQTLANVKYTNVGAGNTKEIILTTELKEMHYVQDGKLCLGNGGAASKTFEDGTYTGTTTLKGHDAGGTQKGVWVE